jgi:hypothetical protein
LDLCHVVVGEEEVDASGELDGPFHDLDEHVEGAVFALGAEGSAVDDFLHEDVSAFEAIEGGDFAEFFEVSGVVVEVAED